MTSPNEATSVAPGDFSQNNDLPIGQLVRRYGERRLGALSDDNMLGPVQLRLARQMDHQARVLGDISAFQMPERLAQTVSMGRRGLHLDVGARHLDTAVDASFGRFGTMVGGAQDLIPTGPWRYQLDASLIQLWLEEELEAQQEYFFTSSPPSPGRRAAPPSPDRKPAPQTPAPRPRRSADIERRLPPAARQVLKAKREEIRKAFLKAVRGDTTELARLTHGKRAAELLQQAQQAAQKAQGTSATAAASSLSQAQLRQLSDTHPTLSVDASGDDFTFEGAAEAILKAAQKAVANASRQSIAASAPLSAQARRLNPGQMAQRAEAITQRASLRAASMFSPTAQEQEAVDQAALALTPFAPTSLIEESTTDGQRALATLGTGIQGAMARLTALPSLAQPSALAASNDQAPSTPWMAMPAAANVEAIARVIGRATRMASAQSAPGRSRSLEAFGSSALKILQMTPSAQDAGPNISRAWLIDGGRGVLIEGMDDAPAPEQGRTYNTVEDTYSAQASRPVTQAAPETVIQRAAPRSAATTLLGKRLQEVLASAQPAPISSPLGLEPARFVAPTTPSVMGYDAAAQGDFAQIIAQRLLAPAAASNTVQTATATAAPAAIPARPAPTQVQLQDVLFSAKQLPALAHSIEQLGQSIDLLGRLVPGANTLSGTARTSGAKTPRPNSIAQVAQRARRLASQGALTSSRIQTLAQDLAETIREHTEYSGGHRLAQVDEGYTQMWADHSLLAFTREINEVVQQSRGVTRPEQQGWLSAARQRTVERLGAVAQSTNAPQTTAVLAEAQQERAPKAAALMPGRALRLFSPAKTMAMLAPELESGGLLDATSRRELASALEDLSITTTAAAPSQRARRVQTPFGTLMVRLDDDGRVAVDTEEISSHAPAVTLRAQRRVDAARAAAASAPSRTAKRASSVNRIGDLSVALSTLLQTTAAGRLTPAAMTEVEVVLGQLGRAERMAALEIGKQDPTAALGERLGLRSQAAVTALGMQDDTVELAGGMRVSRAVAQMRDISAGVLIDLVAQSERSAQLTQALQSAGLAMPAPEMLAPRTAANVQSTATAPEPSPRAVGAALTKMEGAKLGQALSQVGPQRLEVMLDWLEERSVGATAQADTGARPALLSAAASSLLEEAAVARVIGNLGQVGMARPVSGGMTRADMAYALPYVRRSTRGWQRLGSAPTAVAESSSTAPAVQLSSTQQAQLEAMAPALQTLIERKPQQVAKAMAQSSPEAAIKRLETVLRQEAGWLDEGSLVEHGLSLGRSPEWSDSVVRMGLGRVLELEPSAGRGPLFAAVERAIEAKGGKRPTTGALMGSAIAQGTRTMRVPEGEMASVQLAERRRSIERMVRRAPVRRASIERALSAPRAVEGGQGQGPLSSVGTSFSAQSLMAPILKDFQQVEQVLGVLGQRADEAPSAVPSSWSRSESAGALVERSDAAELDIQALERLGVVSQSEAPSRISGRAGRVGIWSPKGVERLLQTGTEALLNGRGDFGATYVAPSLFRLQDRRPTGSSAALRRASPRTSGSSRVAAMRAELETVLPSAALGLSFFEPQQTQAPSAATQRSSESMSMPGLVLGAMRAAGPSSFGASRVQRGTQSLMASMGMEVVTPAASPEAVRPPRALVTSRPEAPLETVKPGPSASLSSRLSARENRNEAARAQTQGQAISSRTLFEPPTWKGTIDGTAGGQKSHGGMAPRAAKDLGSSGGTIDKGESADRKLLAHQTGVPSQEDIEDMAREVLTELKRQWSNELERRGIE